MLNKDIKRTICPVEKAGGLDNKLRRILQNPRRILAPYIKPDMTILDLGCGPGFFTVEIARMLDSKGKVIAADLQEGMLNIIKNKIKETELEKIIKLHKCGENGLGITEKVDFIFAFYVIHEIPNHDNLFNELKSILKPGGKLFIIEPNFHVSKQDFKEMKEKLLKAGFKDERKIKLFLSKSVLMYI